MIEDYKKKIGYYGYAKLRRLDFDNFCNLNAMPLHNPNDLLIHLFLS